MAWAAAEAARTRAPAAAVVAILTILLDMKGLIRGGRGWMQMQSRDE